MVNNSKAKKSAIKTFKRASKKMSKKSLNKSIEKTVSRLILKKAEPKEKTYAETNVQLYHNTPNYTIINSGFNMPVQGQNDETRIGDQMNVGGFYLRMLCGQKYDRPNCTWKIYVFRIPKGTTLTYNSLFHNYTNNILLDNPNKDKCQILKSLTIKKLFSPLVSGGGSKEVTFPVKIWIPYKRVYKFLENGSTQHDDNDIVTVVACYDAFGTLLSDNIAYYQLTTTIYFKDP